MSGVLRSVVTGMTAMLSSGFEPPEIPCLRFSIVPMTVNSWPFSVTSWPMLSAGDPGKRVRAVS